MSGRVHFDTRKRELWERQRCVVFIRERGDTTTTFPQKVTCTVCQREQVFRRAMDRHEAEVARLAELGVRGSQ